MLQEIKESEDTQMAKMPKVRKAVQRGITPLRGVRRKTPKTKMLSEKERQERRVANLFCRIGYLESRFHNLYLSVSESMGRIKALETQLGFSETREEEIRRVIRAVRDENDSSDLMGHFNAKLKAWLCKK